MTEINEFSALGLSEQMLRAVSAKGFELPTPIQKLTIPRLLNQHNDIIAQSQTGTGKTAAFGLPVMQELESSKDGVQALILVPTRELALQASQELLSFNTERRLVISAIYGGAAMSEQLRRLSRGVDIIVGTPGRVLDHLHRGTLRLEKLRYLILDEADEMLNMGFIDDVEEIMAAADKERRVLLFSATMPQRIVSLSERYMHNTEVLRIAAQQMTPALTDQIYFEVREGDKFDALTRIIDIQAEFYGIVFVRTKILADEITTRLLELGYTADALHGDVSQGQREKILKKFKEKLTNILVATDVAARGIDVSNLTHVINYSLPQDSESYVHRIGRTGRAGNQGTAITFITRSEMRPFGLIKRDVNAEIKKEELPSPQDIVAMKRAKIREDLQEIITAETYLDYNDIAGELLADYTPEVAMSALLRLAFRSELDEGNYPEIRSFSVDRRGTARISVALGRKSGYTARGIVDLLKEKCGLPDKSIDNVEVSDDYSFVSVPFNDAEHIIRELNGAEGRPLAGIAPNNEPSRSSSRAPREYRGGGHTGGGGSWKHSDRPDRDRSSRPDRERSSRPDRDRSSRPDRERYSRPDRDRSDRPFTPRPDRDRSDRPFTPRPERDHSDRPERSFDRPDRDRSERPDRREGKPYGFGKPHGAPSGFGKPKFKLKTKTKRNPRS
ncbi:MAG: DEAD/DEAH box helicase [Alistipes sp.]